MAADWVYNFNRFSLLFDSHSVTATVATQHPIISRDVWLFWSPCHRCHYGYYRHSPWRSLGHIQNISVWGYWNQQAHDSTCSSSVSDAKLLSCTLHPYWFTQHSVWNLWVIWNSSQMIPLTFALTLTRFAACSLASTFWELLFLMSLSARVLSPCWNSSAVSWMTLMYYTPQL